MTVPTQTALELPRTGLGAALGAGLQKGSQSGLQALLKNFAATKAAQAKEFQPLTTAEFKGFMGIGDVGKLYPGAESQFKLKKKLDKRISEIGRQKAEEEFGENPLEYLKEPEVAKELTPEEMKRNEVLESLGIDIEKETEESPLKRVMDYLTGKEPSEFEKQFASAVKKKPSQLLQTPIRGLLDFMEQSLGGGAIRFLEVKDGKLGLTKTAAEAWRERAEKGLTEGEKEALQKGEVASVVLVDVVAGLMRKAPQEGLKLAKEVIKEGKYPESVLREVRNITKEYKGKVTPKRLPGKELAPKYQEELIKARKAKAQELAKRPLEKYLKETKPYESPAVKATKAKAATKVGKIDTQIGKAQKNLDTIDKASADLDAVIKRRKVDTGQKMTVAQSNQKQILEKTKTTLESNLEKLNKQKKELEYVAKRGRERFSYEKTLDEANAHNKKIKFAYENPETQEAANIIKQFNRDQKYVQEAMDILKRRPDVPLAPYSDMRINKLKTYNDSYREMIKNLNKEIDVTKGAAKKNLEGLRDKFKANLNINEGKLIQHTEKLETKKTLKEASVFLRKELADLRNDIPGFKKDLIKYKNAIEGGIEAKISKQAQQALKQEYKKSFEEVFKKPTEQNIKKVVQKLEIAEQEAGLKKIPKSEFDKLNTKTKGKVKTKRAIAKGLVLGAIKEFIRAKTGLNIPTRGLTTALGITGGAAGLTYIRFFTDMFKNIKKHVIIRNFKKVIQSRNPRLIEAYRKKLRKKGYSEAQINNLQKLAI